MSAKAIRAVVRGDVIGVGLRDATVARARASGVLGWVRHAEDDATAVGVHAEGEAEAVDALVAFLGDDGRTVELAPRAKVEGHEQFAIRGVPAGAFAVTERDGGGYELRLEVDGAARAWHLSKAPSMVPADKRMAFDAAPDATAARGATWDAGTYEQGGRVPWPAAIDDRGHAVFVLHGETLHGGFALQRTRGRQWLLIKRRDAHAAPSARE